jgi:hypothetical protein
MCRRSVRESIVIRRAGGGSGRTNDVVSAERRCTAELAARRTRPRPDARPSPNESAALKALRRSLSQATEPELRARLERAIQNIEKLYRPPTVDKPGPQPTTPKRCCQYQAGGMRAYVAEQLQIVARFDASGHAVGLPTAEIRRRAIARFPLVTRGKYMGQPTRCPNDELRRIALELRAQGIDLPRRPRTRGDLAALHERSAKSRTRCNTPGKTPTHHGASVADCAA